MEILTVSGQKRRRLEAFSRVVAKELKLAKAAELLGISGSQAKRILARYRANGDAVLWCIGSDWFFRRATRPPFFCGRQGAYSGRTLAVLLAQSVQSCDWIRSRRT